MPPPAKLRRSDIDNLIAQRDSSVFGKTLGDYMEAAPSKNRLREWAEERPGDWVGAIKVLANLSGYSDQREVHHTGVLAHVHAMSDSELLAKIAEVANGKPCEKRITVVDADYATIKVT